MDNKRLDKNVDNVVIMTQQFSSSDWSDMLQKLSVEKDKKLYVQLFKHFAPKIKAYITRLGLVETAAEELMQETMLAVWRKAHLYNRSKAAASTWIFTLARNLSIDWMRKQKYPEYSIDEWQEEPEDHVHLGEQLVTTDRMEKAIDKLPEGQAQVIYMSFFEGRSHTDISERLGLPLGSVKSRIRLASGKLKVMWRDDL